jgi:hypothetical protein
MKPKSINSDIKILTTKIYEQKVSIPSKISNHE